MNNWTDISKCTNQNLHEPSLSAHTLHRTVLRYVGPLGTHSQSMGEGWWMWWTWYFEGVKPQVVATVSVMSGCNSVIVEGINVKAYLKSTTCLFAISNVQLRWQQWPPSYIPHSNLPFSLLYVVSQYVNILLQYFGCNISIWQEVLSFLPFICI